MRIGYSEDEERPGQFALWQANCERSLAGRKGQAALRELEAALVSMPVHRLEMEVFVEPSGEVCALGSLAVARKMREGLTRDEAVAACAELDPEDSQSHGMALGFPSLAAWKVVEVNDIINDSWCWVTCEGPNNFHAYGDHYKAGYDARFPMTPEERHRRVLAWVREHLQE